MEERNLFLAVIISLIVIIGWQMLFPPPKPTPRAPTEQTQTIPSEKPADAPAAEVTPVATAEARIDAGDVQPVAVVEAKDVEVETALYKAVISAKGGGIKSFALKKYMMDMSKDSKPVMLVNPELRDSQRPLAAEIKLAGKPLPINAVYASDKPEIDLESSGADSDSLTLSLKTKSGVIVARKYTFYKNSYKMDFAIDIEETPGPTWEVRPAGVIPVEAKIFWSTISEKEKVDSKLMFYGTIARSGEKEKKFEDRRIPDIRKKGPFNYSNVEWAGFAEGYFLEVLIPEGEKAANVGLTNSLIKINDVEIIASVMTLPEGQVYIGKPYRSDFTLYAGPKDIDEMIKVRPDLEDAIGYGRLKPIVKALVWTLKFFQRYVHNWGLAIILLTVLVRILFFPLTKKSYQSMKAMQALQPRIKEIQEKYKDDREKLNAEVMGLYRTHKINPVGGCLPMLLQIPVLYALYRALYVSIELRHAPFVGWIDDLSGAESILHIPMFGGVDLGFMPLLMGVSMYVQQKMTPTTVTDPMQAKMFAMMPFIFTFISFGFPSGLVLYWFVSNLLTIIQQYVINRRN